MDKSLFKKELSENHNQQYVGLNPICFWSEVKDSSQRADTPEVKADKPISSGDFILANWGDQRV